MLVGFDSPASYLEDFMRILFSDEHVVNNQMHGISRMMTRVLSGLEERGHVCVPLADDVNDGDILLLPANGLVGVPDEQHEFISQCDLPIVSVMYDIIPYIFNERKEQRYIDALEKTRCLSRNIVTISHYSRNDLCRGYGERKGHTELLEAILETDQQLIMVGTPFYYDERTRKLAREAINRGLLVELSGVPDSELISLYQYAQALVYPTKYEGFGLPIIEAMSCGCPVITTDMTAIPEAAGDAALYIEPTTKEIVWAMKRVNTFRYPLRDRGYEQVKKFDWQKIAADYERALRV
jgi:glycosyltransferase involved in cell wall biosynthesis